MGFSNVGYDPGTEVQIATHEISENSETKIIERVALSVGMAERSINTSFELGSSTGMVTGFIDIEGKRIISLYSESSDATATNPVVRILIADTYGRTMFVSSEYEIENTGLTTDAGNTIFSSIIYENIIGGKYLTILLASPSSADVLMYASRV